MTRFGIAILAFLAPVLAAQSSAEIDDAIKRLDGPRDDVLAMEVLIDAGKPAVGPLVEALRSAPEDPDNWKFARIMRVLRAMDVDAGDALPELRELWDSVPTFSKEHRFLRDCLDDTMFQLVAASPERAAGLLTERGGWVLRTQPGRFLGMRCRAIAAIGLPGSHDGAIGSLRSPGLDERILAADTLPSSARHMLPRLLGVLADEAQPTDRGIRGEWFRPLSQDAANRIVHDAVLLAIARIDPDHPKAVRGLASMVEDADDPRHRVRAAAALGRHGEAAAEHVDVLVKALDSEDDRLVAEAVTALGMIGVASDDILDRLRELSTDERPAIAKRAEAALKALERR